MHCTYSRDYTVSVVPDLLDTACPELAAVLGGRRCVVVTTPTVERLLGQALRRYADAWGLDLHPLVLPLDELSKTMSTVLDVCSYALDRGLGRVDVLVALGGGICCDVVSVAATLLRRGTPYVCLPTTLLAQVDAGIGLKGGVNLEGRKNALGSFQPPERVLMDTAWLTSLPPEHVRNGAAEMFKMAVVTDDALFTVLECEGPLVLQQRLHSPQGNWVVRRSIALMLEQLQQNCFEDRSYERLVDFGHTFSPAIEERSRHVVQHGQAVAVDIALSVSIARRSGMLSTADALRIIAAAAGLGLPVWSPLLDLDLVQHSVRQLTAHRGGRLNLVVPVGIGRGELVRDGAALDRVVVSDALSWLRAAAEQHGARRSPAPTPSERQSRPA